MAASIAGYEKLYTILRNKPNTLWVSREPDRTLHILTIRPRYVDEKLGRVHMPGDVDSSGRVIVEFNREGVDIGFEVTNQFSDYIVIDMFHCNEKVANIALKKGETYLFDNRNILDKRRFNLKKKTAGPGGVPLPFASSGPEENNLYTFHIRHLRKSEWPSAIALNMDAEIRVPYVERETSCYVERQMSSLPARASFAEKKSDYGDRVDFLLERPVYRGGLDLFEPTRGPMLSLPAAPARPAYVAEQQLSGINKEQLSSINLDTDTVNFDKISIVTVIKEF